MMDIALKKSYDERFDAVRTLNQQDLLPETDQSPLSEAGEGAFFTYMDQTYVIREKALYEETSEDFKTRKGYIVTELTCLNIDTGDTAYFEWEIDDDLEISVTLERTGFKHLTDDAGEGVDGDDLDQIIQDRDAVLFKGEKFWYEDDWAAIYQRSGKEEQVFLVEFENESGTRFLTIEEWQGSGREAYQIYTSQPVTPGHITLVSKGA